MSFRLLRAVREGEGGARPVFGAARGEESMLAIGAAREEETMLAVIARVGARMRV